MALATAKTIRPAIAVVPFTGLGALTRFPRETFLDGVIFAAILFAMIAGSWALWRLPRRAVDIG